MALQALRFAGDKVLDRARGGTLRIFPLSKDFP